MSKSYSLHFNSARKTWIAKFKKWNGEWGTKFLPKQFQRPHGIEAERYLISWLAEYNVSGATSVKPTTQAAKSIALLSDRWLEMRERDQDTTMNTLRGFKLSMKNWILDNPSFPHHSIQNLDVESELTVQELKSWIDSLKGAPASRIQHINTLSSFFNDCISMNWLDENMANPLDKPAMRKEVQKIKRRKTEEKVISHMTVEQVETLLTQKHKHLSDYRRLRYLLALTAGLRDHEVQGLTWQDIDFKQKTLTINKQLAKRGSLPLLRIRDLEAKGMSKVEVFKLPNALAGKPKSYSSNRTLPLHPLTLEALKAWQQKGWKNYVGKAPNQADPLFPRGRGAAMGNGNIGQPGDFCFSESAGLVREDLERLELPTTFTDSTKGITINLDFHSLRHTFSHLLELAGADEAQIGVLLGHAPRNVVRSNYLSKNMKVFRDLVERLPLPSSVTLDMGNVGVRKVVPLRVVKTEAG